MKILNVVFIRLLVGVITLCGVAIVIFIALRAMPASFEDIVLGPISSPEARATVAKRFGLDRPPREQFFFWFGEIVKGDLGMSLVTQSPVGKEIARRAPATIQLTLMATAIGLLVGFPLGTLAGLSNSGRLVRGVGRVIGAVGASVPNFVIGSAFVYIFSVWSLGLKVGGYVPFFEDPVTNLRAITLPAITLGVFGIALILRTTRDSVQRVLTEGHITTAVAGGQTEWQIVRRHVLRNASIPIFTVTATYVGYLLSGAVIIEVLYSLPGIGLYTFNALENRDYAVVQAGVLLAAAVFVTINTLSDIIYVILDPRIAAAGDTQ
jgi:peptide/nickel transport system permease protein